MKQAPFNISMVLLGTYLAVAILGGIVGSIAAGVGIGTLLGAFLAGFIPVPFGGVVRRAIGGFFADQAGVEGRAPVAFSLGLRLIIGAGAALVIAYLFTSMQFYSIGFGLGAVCALLTGIIVSLVFLLKTSMGKN